MNQIELEIEELEDKIAPYILVLSDGPAGPVGVLQISGLFS